MAGTAIVVGYLDTPEGEAALARAIDEGALRKAKVVVIQSHKGGSSLASAEARELEDSLDSVTARLVAAGVEHDVRQLVRGRDVAEDLIDVATEVDADLIVIGLRRRSPVGKLLLGSNAQQILLDAPCAVLAVKA